MNVMMLSVPVWSGNVTDMIPEQRDFFHWLSALIALPAAAYSGQPFFMSAFRALRARRTIWMFRSDRHRAGARDVGGRNVPPCRACLFRRGADADRLPGGRPLSRPEHAPANSRGRRKSRRIKAETATKFVGDDEICEVPIAAVEAGDIVLLRPGERSAVDGVVIEGSPRSIKA